jgi:hypothetical protein
MDDLITCDYCGKQTDDLRFGCCFMCASAGEEKAAKRTVAQHVLKGFFNLFRGNISIARIDFVWAWERASRTGDYAAGGVFDREGYQWR